MSNLWARCGSVSHVAPLKVQVFRIVESQQQVATLNLVNSGAEQAVLEEILEAGKPPLPEGGELWHYLIQTPFRYPPLPHGSRFGRRSRPGIFYASLRLRTALAECAYYRFVFWEGMEQPPPGQLVTGHTTFKVTLETDQGIRLDRPSFSDYRDLISSPADYAHSQALGDAMREDGVQAFVFPSARQLPNGRNAVAFAIDAIASRKPRAMEEWICATAARTVSFVARHADGQPYTFSLEEFLVEGELPQPAV